MSLLHSERLLGRLVATRNRLLLARPLPAMNECKPRGRGYVSTCISPCALPGRDRLVSETTYPPRLGSGDPSKKVRAAPVRDGGRPIDYYKPRRFSAVGVS